MNKYLIIAIVIILIGSFGVTTYLKNENTKLESLVKVSTTKVDTFYIERIIVDSIPYPKYKEVIKYKKDTLRTTDTIPKLVEVYIPIDSIIYSKTLIQNTDTITYDAYVSGYKASLDSIKFRLKYPYIKETNYTPIKSNDSRISFSIQSGIGYGIINKKPDIFIGVGISYKLK